MYLSTRAAVVRNLATAITNGSITLILLLIAPLGLAAVIGNTFLVTLASFFVGTFADMVVDWLRFSGSGKRNKFTAFEIEKELQSNQKTSNIRKKSS